jgi:hypothetical protein
MAEGKSSAVERADLYKDLGQAQLEAVTASNGGMIEHDAGSLKEVDSC